MAVDLVPWAPLGITLLQACSYALRALQRAEGHNSSSVVQRNEEHLSIDDVGIIDDLGAPQHNGPSTNLDTCVHAHLPLIP